MPMDCPYCGEEAVKQSGKVLYPAYEKLSSNIFYVCVPCSAWVGTHKQSGLPLGTLANKELRSARIKCHSLFEEVQHFKNLKRGELYSLLAKGLNIPKEQTHFGMFTLERCAQAQNILRLKLEVKDEQNRLG